MTTFDPTVRDLLDGLVPDFDGREGDWQGVLRAAQPPGRALRRPPRRWTLAIAMSLVALAIGLLATPALGLGAGLLRLIGFSAPPAIKHRISQLSAPSPGVITWLGDQGFGIRASQTRGIFKIQTSKGPIWLWAAPSSHGVCRFVQMPPVTYRVQGKVVRETRPQGPLACIGPASRYTRLDGALETPKNWPSQLDRPLLHGHVYQPVSSVRLDFTDGTHQSLPLRDGFFLVLLPPDKQALDLVARDANGKIVANEPLLIKPPAALPPMHPLIRVATPYGLATLSVTRPEDPKHCYRVEIDLNSSGGCGTPMQGPVTYNFQQQGESPNAIALLNGFVKPDVTALHVKLANGTTLLIPLHHTYFLYPLRANQRPLQLIAHTREREVRVPMH